MNIDSKPTSSASCLTLTFVRLSWLYCSLCLGVVWLFDIFSPLRLEVTISLLACCIIPVLIHYFDYQHEGSTHSEVRQQSFKLHFWASVIFLLLVPFFSSDKISTLNHPLTHHAQHVSPPIQGYIALGEVRIPTHRQPVEGVIFTTTESQPVICDLLTRKRCPYIDQFNQVATVQLSTRTLWPYRNLPVLFSFKTDHLQFDQQQHVRFYRQQQYATMAYFLFIFFPSFWLFFRMRYVLLQHYFDQTK